MALLKKRDCYGYEIAESLSEKIDIADGTVYPILRKLKTDGLLSTYLQEESGGPPRKYYSLTELGKKTFEKDRGEYLLFADSVKKVLEDEDHDYHRRFFLLSVFTGDAQRYTRAFALNRIYLRFERR